MKFLNQPLPEFARQPRAKPCPFRHSITLHELSFRYTPDTPWVLRKLNLKIPKGSRIGIMGTTGSGKSTLIDIVMGLLEPTSGTLEVDGRAVTSANKGGWQAHIAHVPQSIYLSDTTMAENIAFGIPESENDYDRVREAAENTQIASTIEGWTNQYRTKVDEGGIHLSGGQNQRIGIAQAFYDKSNVIILDQATSALDNETETSVMDAIDHLSQDLTFIIIAARLSIFRSCPQVVELEQGGIQRVGSYQEIVINPSIKEPGVSLC